MGHWPPTSRVWPAGTADLVPNDTVGHRHLGDVGLAGRTSASAGSYLQIVGRRLNVVLWPNLTTPFKKARASRGLQKNVDTTPQTSPLLGSGGDPLADDVIVGQASQAEEVEQPLL